jgi:hypothetical protein
VTRARNPAACNHNSARPRSILIPGEHPLLALHDTPHQVGDLGLIEAPHGQREADRQLVGRPVQVDAEVGAVALYGGEDAPSNHRSKHGHRHKSKRSAYPQRERHLAFA